VAGEALLALLGVHSVALSAAALLAPGWALASLLPAPVRAHGLARLAAGPALGIAASAVPLITVAWLGVPLTGVSVRVVLLLVVALALPTWPPSTARLARPTAAQALEAAGLVAALAVSLFLAMRVVGTGVVPGNDWAKYLLYADEIRAHGALLIDNPFWMLGVPFREDPGVPALYGGLLLLADAPAAVLARGIVVLTLVEIAAAYAFARAFWGRAAGVLAAFLLGVVPATQDMLGWHGLANVGALALLALGLAYLAAWAAGALDRRGIAGAALVLVGIAAAHRLTFLVALGVAALVVVAVLALALRAGDVRARLRPLLWIAGLALVGGIGVWASLYEVQRTFGGTQPYTAYLATKIDLSLAVRDVSWVLAVGAAVALVIAAVRYRGDRALWPLVALLVVAAALGYAWVVHVPTYYARMVYYAPLGAAPLVAAVAVRLRPRAVVAVVAAAALAFTASEAYDQGPKVKAFYAFADAASLRGLNGLASELRPDEVVATDRCWSFLSTWLLHTRTLPALTPQDIQPQAELRIARQAQAVLDGTRAGRRIARRLGVRYAVVDPTCPDEHGARLPPPGAGTLVYASRRLAILRLSQ
jgi:hypothetical protein